MSRRGDGKIEAWWERATRAQPITNALGIRRGAHRSTPRSRFPSQPGSAGLTTATSKLHTEAIAWTRTAVLVLISAPRWLTIGVWLPPGDVTRR